MQNKLAFSSIQLTKFIEIFYVKNVLFATKNESIQISNSSSLDNSYLYKYLRKWLLQYFIF